MAPQTEAAPALPGGSDPQETPLEIVKKLMAFGEGVAFLAESFQAMIHEINERGHLSPEACRMSPHDVRDAGR